MDKVIQDSGTYFLYDDDCGVCTKSSKIFAKILGDRIKVLPMHLPEVEKQGMKEIPDEYWKSFHIVENGTWYTEGSAILQLSSQFPLGSIVRKIAEFPPIYYLLVSLLRNMQYQRKAECVVQL